MSPIWSFQHSQSGCSSFWCIVRITLYLTKRLAVLGVHERLEMTGGAGCTMKVDRRGEYFCVGPLRSKFHHCSMIQLWHIHQKHLLHGCLCAKRRVYIDPPRNHGTHFRNICWLFVVVFATWYGLPTSCLFNFECIQGFVASHDAAMYLGLMDPSA